MTFNFRYRYCWFYRYNSSQGQFSRCLAGTYNYTSNHTCVLYSPALSNRRSVPPPNSFAILRGFVNLLNPKAYFTYHHVYHSEILCSTHSAFMCFVWISVQTAIISLHSTNLSVYITEAESVYCAVRTGSSIPTCSYVLKY
jgi:hypothetical protein